MSKTTRKIFYKLLFSGIILIAILFMQPLELFLFAKDIAVIFPSGKIAFEQRDLLLLIQALMLFIVIPVFVLTFIFSWHYRAENKEAVYDPHLVDHKIAEVVWWGLPLALTIVVSVITWYATHRLDPYKPLESDKQPVNIEVVALQWKWLFIYPEEGIASLNYLRFPKETPLAFSITADAPMNSFWIPKLGGQIYAMPGMRTMLHLIANEEGKFRGSSANISGAGFSGMHFIAESVNDESYQEWIDSVKKEGEQLNAAVYEELAKPSKNDPVKVFNLQDHELFHEIQMKFMKPRD